MQYLKYQILKLLKDMNIAKKFTMLKNGKDAAVAYGSIDFKFKNNNDFDIKIYATAADVPETAAPETAVPKTEAPTPSGSNTGLIVSVVIVAVVVIGVAVAVIAKKKK